MTAPDHTHDALTVGPAELDDHAFLVACNQAMAWETEQRRLDPERLSNGVMAVLTDPAKGRYFVARRDGRAVAGLLITHEWSDWRNAQFWWIQSVYVVPEARRGGAFRALYRQVESLAIASGACALRLYVERDNSRAQSTYSSLGMHQSHYQMFERTYIDTEV
ncbi:MAG: GNAT family N-acetyltransferase [Xanthomonadales bacterium]|nr:GNAT family N-acetyltransferase [Xanthomonadales bacterium]